MNIKTEYKLQSWASFLNLLKLDDEKENHLLKF